MSDTVPGDTQPDDRIRYAKLNILFELLLYNERSPDVGDKTSLSYSDEFMWRDTAAYHMRAVWLSLVIC